MARRDRLLDAMRANPAGDWTIDDVRTLCLRQGLIFEPPRRGSHFTVKAPTGTGFVSLPGRRPIKPVYIREVVKLIGDVIDKPDEAE